MRLVFEENHRYICFLFTVIFQEGHDRGEGGLREQEEEARNSEQKELRSRLPCLWLLGVSRLGARN